MFHSAAALHRPHGLPSPAVLHTHLDRNLDTVTPTPLARKERAVSPRETARSSLREARSLLGGVLFRVLIGIFRQPALQHLALTRCERAENAFQILYRGEFH